MKEKHCNGCASSQEESFALSLLREYSRYAKRWFFISLVVIGTWLSTIIGFVLYLNQYDFYQKEISEISQEGKTSYEITGVNICIEGYADEVRY